jgi:hypothetical protein
MIVTLSEQYGEVRRLDLAGGGRGVAAAFPSLPTLFQATSAPARTPL